MLTLLAPVSALGATVLAVALAAPHNSVHQVQDRVVAVDGVAHAGHVANHVPTVTVPVAHVPVAVDGSVGVEDHVNVVDGHVGVVTPDVLVAPHAVAHNVATLEVENP